MKANPLPSPEAVARQAEGRGRARTIRRLYAARASLHEIADFLGIGIDEIRRTLHRPVRA